jgi:hypothetical protein
LTFTYWGGIHPFELLKKYVIFLFCYARHLEEIMPVVNSAVFIDQVTVWTMKGFGGPYSLIWSSYNVETLKQYKD